MHVAVVAQELVQVKAEQPRLEQVPAVHVRPAGIVAPDDQVGRPPLGDAPLQQPE